ncbi:MAG: CvpA family protein [Clostridia bacterium]|nr:CvpA family protein [Clostridia bacterium]
MNALCMASPAAYIVDAVILVALVVFVMICAKRGFVKMIFHFASGLVALIAAIALAKVVVSVTGGLFGLLDSLTNSFTNTFSKLNGFNVDISGQNVEELLASRDVSAIIATLIAKKYVGVELEAGTTLGYLAGSTMAELLCTLIAGVVLFFVLKIVFKLLSKIFTAIISKIKLLGKVNRLLGALVGIIEGIFFISLAISILALIPSEGMMNFFNGSIILRLLYNHNPIVWMLGWFL